MFRFGSYLGEESYIPTKSKKKKKHSCKLKFLTNLVQNIRRSSDVQYLSEILNSYILSVSFKPPAVNGIYIKVKIYLFIQTTRYFILTIEAVKDDHIVMDLKEERVFETESTIFLLKFLSISCFFFYFSNIVKTTISQAKRGCASVRVV